MNIDYYNKFKGYEEKGLKREASKSIRDFITSFNDEEEIKNWVLEYLPKLETNSSSRIRHEIFHELVYPILKEGFLNNQYSETLWLGKLAQNIYQSPRLHEELNWVTELEIYNRCYDLDTENDEARLFLLKSIVSWLEYSEHEWPSGILYGNDGATEEQCKEISSEVQKVLQLDKEQRYTDFIKQYNKRLSSYRARLNK